MAHSVQRPTPDFSSFHDLAVREFEPPPPASGSALALRHLLGILSLSHSPSLPLPCFRALSLSQNKYISIKKNKGNVWYPGSGRVRVQEERGGRGRDLFKRTS